MTIVFKNIIIDNKYQIVITHDIISIVNYDISCCWPDSQWVEGGHTAAALWGVASMTCSILLTAFLCSCRQAFFSIRLVSVHIVHPCSSIDTTAAWKKLRFILSVRSDFHMTDSLSLAAHAFESFFLMSVSVDETLLPR